ncbi:MAG: nitrophenyl compound nitroreductase subunit ArsF family protein [Candidatus Gribaldobacteria bacterium]|nr:nitrophenyl compound nitroreductase subunit ArsF family protein [Candidatus Gribaldobacteria bacterium]
MQKKIIIIIIGIAIIGLMSLAALNDNKLTEAQSPKNLPADKVEVFLFHATKRCITCITIGKLAGETVNEYFQPELKNGQIEFREINIDLPENKDMARKFQASGSSLFINAISNGKDNIAQDTKVWLLVSSETQFKSYLKDKIDNLLGK